MDWLFASSCETRLLVPKLKLFNTESCRLIPEWYHQLMALTLRTDAALDEALSSLSEFEGISRQEVIRRAVLDRLERSRHVAHVDDSTRRMATRWNDVIERLGAT